jgi:hypothetical protein
MAGDAPFPRSDKKIASSRGVNGFLAYPLHIDYFNTLYIWTNKIFILFLKNVKHVFSFLQHLCIKF